MSSNVVIDEPSSHSVAFVALNPSARIHLPLATLEQGISKLLTFTNPLIHALFETLIFYLILGVQLYYIRIKGKKQ
jgi:hypothetical protein